MSYILMMFDLVVKWGFTITLPMLFLMYFIKKDWRSLIKIWLSYSYVLVFIYLIVELTGKIAVFIEQLITPLSSNKVYDYYHSAGYGATLYLILTLKLLLIVAFTFKRIRNSIGWGIVALLMLQNEELTLAVWYEFKDYYPSSWAIYYHLPFKMNLCVFCLIVFNLIISTLYFSKKFLLKNTSQAPSL